MLFELSSSSLTETFCSISFKTSFVFWLSLRHPRSLIKQKTKIENEDFADNAGTISTNFASVEGKRVVVVDDVITSGKTMDEVIKTIKDLGGEPIAVAVLIDKAGFDYIDGVPVKSLISVSRLG